MVPIKQRVGRRIVEEEELRGGNMPTHYDDGEYRGSEHATDVFQAPPKEKTEGEKLEESGDYIDSGEGTDAEGNLLKSTGEAALWGLEKYGQAIDWTNDQVNLRNALGIRLGADKTPDWLDNVLDYSYKDLRDHTAGGIGNVVGAVTGSERANDIGELAGQILLPDAIDFATGGVGYADNIARAATKLRKLDGKTASALVEDIFSKPRFKAVAEGARESVYEAARNLRDTVTAPIRTVQEVATGGMFGSVGAWSDRADMAKQRLNMQVRMAGSGMGFKDNIFNFDDYLKVRSKHSEADRRWFSGIFSTPVDYGTYRKGFATSASEAAHLKRLKADFMKTYTPEFLEKYGIKAGDIQAHHIDALMASLPLYDGVEYLSKEWYHITGTLLNKNVNPGNVPENIKYLVGRRGWPKTPHGITHSYLDEIVGPDGQKLFTADIRARMKTDPAFRTEMAEKWADITIQSNQIADQAAGVFNAMNADLLNLQPKDIDQIMSSLGKLQNNGLVKPELIDGKWQIGAKEMRELLFDIDFTQNIGQHFLLANPQGLRALRIALQSDNPVSAYKAVKETLPQQLRLFKDDKVKTLAKKSRRYNNPKWDIPDDVSPPRGEGEFPETGEGLDEFGNPL